MHNMFAALWTVTSPAMVADYCEYQQWKTGDRLDGYMSQYSQVITTLCGMLSGWMTTELLIKFAGAASSEDYGEEGVMQSVLIIWGILSIACGVLATIPFLFWDLTEKKQLEMTRDIKIRGFKEAMDSGTLEQENVAEAIELGVLTAEQATQMGFAVEALQQSAVGESVAQELVEDVADQLSTDESTTEEHNDDVKF